MMMYGRSCLRSLLCLSCLCVSNVAAQNLNDLHKDLDRLAQDVESQIIAWRRDFHEHPELSHREFRTAKIVAEHLTQLGMEVQVGVAHTGVVGILRGDSEGPVVALRADMDALPITEELDIPFASRVRDTWEDKEVGVMHACGHDAHTAILMGAAEVLANVREELPGTVKFIFQPAEELGFIGAPAMIRQGVLEAPEPGAIFGLHVGIDPWKTINFRSGGMMASGDGLHIVIRGRQTHGAMPWNGVDPIAVAAQVVTGLQTIVSRQMDITRAPAVVSIGTINGGIRGNIIPEEVEMTGTIRTLDSGMREDIHQRVQRTVTKIAESAGATAEVNIKLGSPVVYNDPGLASQMTPTLRRVAGEKYLNVNKDPMTGAEDFAFYQERIPGLFFFLGTAPKDADPATLAPPHNPKFNVEDSALINGVRALSNLAVDYLLIQSAN